MHISFGVAPYPMPEMKLDMCWRDADSGVAKCCNTNAKVPVLKKSWWKTMDSPKLGKINCSNFYDIMTMELD